MRIIIVAICFLFQLVWINVVAQNTLDINVLKKGKCDGKGSNYGGLELVPIYADENFVYLVEHYIDKFTVTASDYTTGAKLMKYKKTGEFVKVSTLNTLRNGEENKIRDFIHLGDKIYCQMIWNDKKVAHASLVELDIEKMQLKTESFSLGELKYVRGVNTIISNSFDIEVSQNKEYMGVYYPLDQKLEVFDKNLNKIFERSSEDIFNHYHEFFTLKIEDNEQKFITTNEGHVVFLNNDDKEEPFLLMTRIDGKNVVMNLDPSLKYDWLWRKFDFFDVSENLIVLVGLYSGEGSKNAQDGIFVQKFNSESGERIFKSHKAFQNLGLDEEDMDKNGVNAKTSTYSSRVGIDCDYVFTDDKNLDLVLNINYTYESLITKKRIGFKEFAKSYYVIPFRDNKITDAYPIYLSNKGSSFSTSNYPEFISKDIVITSKTSEVKPKAKSFFCTVISSGEQKNIINLAKIDEFKSDSDPRIVYGKNLTYIFVLDAYDKNFLPILINH